MNKHTPGPWIAIRAGGLNWHVAPQAVAEDGRFAVATVFSQNYHPDGPHAADIETCANARLIAAAPELLDALRELSAPAFESLFSPGNPSIYCERCDSVYPENEAFRAPGVTACPYCGSELYQKEIPGPFDRARAAIAKATGDA